MSASNPIMDNANPLVSEIALPTRRRRNPEIAKQVDASIHALWESVKANYIVEEIEVPSSGSETEHSSDAELDVDPIDAQEIYGKLLLMSNNEPAI